MMMVILLAVGCMLGLVFVVAIGIVVFMIVQSNQDTVSTAREDWIQRRSDKDEHDW